MSYDRGQPRQGCDSSGSDVEKEEGAEGSQAGMQDSPGASWERGRSKASTPFPPSPQQRHLETHLLLTPRAPASLSNLLNLPSGQSAPSEQSPRRSPANNTPGRTSASPSRRYVRRDDISAVPRSLRQRSPIRSITKRDPLPVDGSSSSGHKHPQRPSESHDSRNRSASPRPRMRQDRPPTLELPHLADVPWGHQFRPFTAHPRTAPILRSSDDHFPGVLQRRVSDDGGRETRERRDSLQSPDTTRTSRYAQGPADVGRMGLFTLPEAASRQSLPEAWLALGPAPNQHHRYRSAPERHSYMQGWEDAMHAVGTGVITTMPSGHHFRVILSAPRPRQDDRQAAGLSSPGVLQSGDVPQPHAKSFLPFPPRQSFSLRHSQRPRESGGHNMLPVHSWPLGQRDSSAHQGYLHYYHPHNPGIRPAHTPIVHPPPATNHFDLSHFPFGPPSNSSSSPGNHQTGSSKRAKRQQISCWPCRERKLKCDGRTPCAACSKRHIDGQCTYAESVRRRGRGKKAANGGQDPGLDQEGVPENSHERSESSVTAQRSNVEQVEEGQSQGEEADEGGRSS